MPTKLETARAMRFTPSALEQAKTTLMGFEQTHLLYGRGKPVPPHLVEMRAKVAAMEVKHANRKPRKAAGSDGRKLERDVNREIEQVAKQFDNVKLWRNNRGQVMLSNGGRLMYGVGPDGASDYIGYRTLTITPDMVGKQIAQFMGVESKRPGAKPRTEQLLFAARVNHAGGHACIAESGEDAADIFIMPLV